MASTGEVWRLGRRPALDGLRGVAVLLVVAHHLRVPLLGNSGGPVGVAVFFTLSGFLISTLLLEESTAGRVSIGGFYLRRAARLLPALGMCLLLWTGVDLVVNGRLTETPLLLGAVTYTANLVMASGLYDASGAALGHLWSLAVEEQFYLVWPFVLLGLRRFPKPLVVSLLGAAALGSLALRQLDWAMGRGGDLGYYGTLERADGLLVGCIVAFVLHGRARRPVPRRVLPVASSGVLACALATGHTEYVLLPTAVSLLTAAMLWAISAGHGGRLEGPVLRWFGRRSYGLYLYHPVVMYAVAAAVPGAGWLRPVIVVAVSLAVTELSWSRLERPVMAWARSLRSRSQGEALQRQLVQSGGVQRERAA